MAEGTVEQAFRLAAECKSIDELRAKLKAAGCPQVDAYLGDNTLRRSLNKLLKK